MKIMKNINKIGGLLLASVLATGCYNEPLSEYSSLRDFAYTWGSTNNNNSPIIMQQNEQMSFLNMSQGALSATWTVPEDCGIYFLGDEYLYFTEDDPDTTADETSKVDYESMIIDHAYTFSDNKKAVHLYFTESGSFSVNLRCTYDRNVTYTLYSTVLEKEITYSSVYENGVYVIDKDIDLFVVSDAIVPVLTVKYSTGGEEWVFDMNEFDADTDPADYPSVTLKYGESLSFSDAFETVDIINARSWSSGNPVLSSTATAPTFTFRPNALIEPGVDTCKVYYQATRWSVGSYIESELKSDEIHIPLNIFVEENVSDLSVSASYYSNTTTDYLNKNLRVTLSNGQFDENTLLEAKAEDFVVAYTNEAAGITETQYIPVDTVYYVNANSKHILNVFLDEKIYTSDTATISYVGDDIDVLFNGTVSKFTLEEKTIAMSAVVSFDYNFEDVDNVDSWQIIIPEDLSVYQPWTGTHSEPTLEEEDGNHYISITPDPQTYLDYSPYFINTDTFTGKMGNNVMTGKIRVSSSNATNLSLFFPTDITQTTTINATGFAGSQVIDFTGLVNDVWHPFEITFTKASSITGYLNIHIAAQRGTIDFDDLYLTNIEARPTDEEVTE
ncbi:MAG: hypothetical protein SNH55_03960 [Rikenellaceae bacterium]